MTEAGFSLNQDFYGSINVSRNARCHGYSSSTNNARSLTVTTKQQTTDRVDTQYPSDDMTSIQQYSPVPILLSVSSYHFICDHTFDGAIRSVLSPLSLFHSGSW